MRLCRDRAAAGCSRPAAATAGRTSATGLSSASRLISRASGRSSARHSLALDRGSRLRWPFCNSGGGGWGGAAVGHTPLRPAGRPPLPLLCRQPRGAPHLVQHPSLLQRLNNRLCPLRRQLRRALHQCRRHRLRRHPDLRGWHARLPVGGRRAAGQEGRAQGAAGWGRQDQAATCCLLQQWPRTHLSIASALVTVSAFSGSRAAMCTKTVGG